MKNNGIPMLDIARQTALIRPEVDAAIARVLDHGRFIMGPEVGVFEQQIAEYCGTRFAIACASGSDAILLPLAAFGIGPGDKVVTTPFSFFATAGSIARLGAEPVFLDIDPETYNLDAAQLAEYLGGQSASGVKSIKAILPVHLFGQCAQMDEIDAVANRFGIPVVEDAAQAIGAEFDGARAGSLARCAAFSFFPSKNLGGLGDGGLITTDDEELTERLRMLRNHGASSTYVHPFVGMNSRLDTLQAAVLSVKFRYLDAWTARRRANAATYRRHLREMLNGTIVAPAEHPRRLHVYNQFTIRIPDRDRVRGQLASCGIATAVYYPIPLHLQDCFQHLGYREGDLPHSERAAHEVLSLPIEPGLTDDDIRIVVTKLAEALRESSALH
ncbi:MAG: DegT/DnrJ/EryC1/StrS family aminotransferase [Terriglobia bacterium]